MRHYKVSSMPASMKTLPVGIISHFHVFVHLVENMMEQKQTESVKTKDICQSQTKYLRKLYMACICIALYATSSHPHIHTLVMAIALTEALTGTQRELTINALMCV